MNVAAVSPDLPERLRRISVEEYHRMIEARILGEDEDCAYRKTRAYRPGDTLMAPFGEGIPVDVAGLVP